MAFIPARGILFGRGGAFRAACRIQPGATAPSAWLSCCPRDFVCVGFPARRAAPERAVSLSGGPENGFPHSAAAAHGGQPAPGRNTQRSRSVYEPIESLNSAVVLRVAGTPLYGLPGQTRRNPPSARPRAHETETPRKRGSFIRRRSVSRVCWHHHFTHPGVARGWQIQPHGRVFLDLVRHH